MTRCPSVFHLESVIIVSVFQTAPRSVSVPAREHNTALPVVMRSVCAAMGSHHTMNAAAMAALQKENP